MRTAAFALVVLCATLASATASRLHHPREFIGPLHDQHDAEALQTFQLDPNLNVSVTLIDRTIRCHFSGTFPRLLLEKVGKILRNTLVVTKHEGANCVLEFLQVDRVAPGIFSSAMWQGIFESFRTVETVFMYSPFNPSTSAVAAEIRTLNKRFPLLQVKAVKESKGKGE